MADILAALQKEIGTSLEEINEFRRQVHMFPELGYKEFDTTGRIDVFLQEHGVNVSRFHKITGAVAVIDNNCEKTIGLRVDIDALPVAENTGLEFASRNKGIMHACGHDLHTAVGVGLAVVLNHLKEYLPVNVKIIFQPAEECSPTGGARHLINEGVCKNPDISALLGFHVWPDLLTNQIGVKEGSIMAASDKFKITVKGKKSHAAQPYNGIDAIDIAVNIIGSINSKLKKEIRPLEPFLISVGMINSKGRYNIICDHVEFEGTIRTLSEETRITVHKKLKKLVHDIASMYGGTCRTVIKKGYNSVINDKKLTQDFIKHAISILGEENVKTGISPSLIGEDFSFYGEHVPTLYFHLGCDCEFPLHSDRFYAREETLGVALKILGSFIILNSFS